ncbi:MAG: sigma-70 family RNA polymerase sigma factor [Planctomycetes bacterium]|nr:sigma-70 family RNA polymerase sigma factor [Planctomycetota bacterium]NOG52845.1 sigma-70 family RNA polymerase sigma factor [Planctomycetota bacterium]
MNAVDSNSPPNDDLPSDDLDRMFNQFYPDLRRIAENRMRGERRAHTLQATELINEAYLKLIRNSAGAAISKTRFKACAARAMFEILCDHARKRNADKRGGQMYRVTLHTSDVEMPANEMDVLDLEAVLTRLQDIDQRAAEVVKLRFVGGLTMAEIASILSVSKRSAESDWTFARAWLRRELHEMK